MATIYLRIGGDDFKLGPAATATLLRLKRNNALTSKTVMSSNPNILQHVYAHEYDVETIAKTLIHTFFHRFINPLEVPVTLEELKHLWSLATLPAVIRGEVSAFCDKNNNFMPLCLMVTTGSASARHIEEVVQSSKLIEALYRVITKYDTDADNQAYRDSANELIIDWYPNQKIIA